MLLSLWFTALALTSASASPIQVERNQVERAWFPANLTKGPITSNLQYSGFSKRSIGFSGTPKAGKLITYNNGQPKGPKIQDFTFQWDHTYIHLKADPKLCLAAGAGPDGVRNPKAGQQAFLTACDPLQAEWKEMGGGPLTTQWRYDRGMLQLRATDLCLDLENRSQKQNTKIVLVPCKGNATINTWLTFPYVLTDGK